jgi:hypothetical protein
MTTPKDRAWRFASGEIEMLTLPPHPDFYYPPEGLKNVAVGTQEMMPAHLISGEHASDFESYCLPVICDIATDLTPWTTWYLSSSYFGAGTCSGCAWGSQDVAAVRSCHRPVGTIATAYHEAWHLAEARMSATILEKLDAQLATGPDWPGEYLNRPCERRARAFSSFCMLMVEGARQVVTGPGAPLEIELFWHVFGGDFGREVVRHRAEAEPPPKPPKSKVSKVLEFIF